MTPFGEILDMVDEMNISEKNSLTYKAAVIILFGMLNENFMSFAVIEASRQTRVCKISFTDTLKIQRNLRENRILENGKIVMSGDCKPGSQGWIIEFTLMAMAGAGIIVVHEVLKPATT